MVLELAREVVDLVLKDDFARFGLLGLRPAELVVLGDLGPRLLREEDAVLFARSLRLDTQVQ